MKKLFVVLFLTVLCAGMVAQSTQFYRTTSVATSARASTVDPWSEWSRTKTDYLVTINTDGAVVSLDNSIGSVFYLRSLISNGTAKDNEGDAYDWAKFLCVDEETVICSVIIQEYVVLNYTRLFIEYDNVKVMVDCYLLK